MLTGSKKHLLQKIHQMERKDYDLIPATQAVRSAIQHINEIESFFQEKSNNQIVIYPLLAMALSGSQYNHQPNIISGRLFYNVSCFIQQNEAKGIMKKANIEFNTKECKKYNFISEDVVEKLDNMLKARDIRKIDDILKSIVNDIDNNLAWIRFWQKRKNIEGVDKELINKITQALVYKIAGVCHEVYVMRNTPSNEQQLADAKLIHAFKISALQVSSSIPLDWVSEENILLNYLNKLENTEQNTTSSTNNTNILPIEGSFSPITNQYANLQSFTSTKVKKKVKKMVDEYQEKHLALLQSKFGMNKKF